MEKATKKQTLDSSDKEVEKTAKKTRGRKKKTEEPGEVSVPETAGKEGVAASGTVAKKPVGRRKKTADPVEVAKEAAEAPVKKTTRGRKKATEAAKAVEPQEEKPAEVAKEVTEAPVKKATRGRKKAAEVVKAAEPQAIEAPVEVAKEAAEAPVKKATRGRKKAVKLQETEVLVEVAQEAAKEPVKKVTRGRKKAVKPQEAKPVEVAKETTEVSKSEPVEAVKETVKKTATKAKAVLSGKRTAAKKTKEAKETKQEVKTIAVDQPVDPFITEIDQYLFGKGTHYDIYKKLGAHLTEKDGVKGVHFAVWAPNAEYASVLGDFNGWNSGATPMTRLEPMGIWETFVPGLSEGEIYKYYMHTKNGWDLEKADPYASSAEIRPGTASRVAVTEHYKWADQNWMKQRAKMDLDTSPMSIYEVHPGSWKRHAITEGQKDYEAFYNYREFAQELVEYVKDMGYTHVELIGISEHPLDASWGYQVTGYFAPTSRYGTPEDFMYFVDYLHEHKIGVILDWVPAHFPKDGFGLAEFDGTCLYEHQNPMQGEHPHWGTKIFNFGRNEVQNFLIASALNWIEHYHVDGLRVDAVASMLYLDYGRDEGQWIPNKNGGRENLEAIAFLQHLNTIVNERDHGAMVIAEESTAWPKVTGPIEEDGLGFALKWNMGWMNDFLEYQQQDPIYRKYHHNQMTFSMMYAFSEKFILTLSHDEVVHLKKSMLSKMPGPYYDQVANLKAAYAFMMGHPGKKLLFMGQDFGQWTEWNEDKELDWYLLDGEKNGLIEGDLHRKLQNFVKALLHLYQKNPALYEQDGSWEGFEWINANDGDRSIFSFIRHSKDNKKNLVFICNFTPVERGDYRFGMPEKKRLKLILDSDEAQYGGGEMKHGKTFTPKAGECDGKPFYVEFPLPAYGVAIFQY